MDDHHVHSDPFYAPPPLTGAVRPAPPAATEPVPQQAVPHLTVPVPAAEPAPEPAAEVVPTETPGQPRHIPKSHLYAMRLSDLQDHARALGLDHSGKRPALIARIKNRTEPSAGPVQF